VVAALARSADHETDHVRQFIFIQWQQQQQHHCQQPQPAFQPVADPEDRAGGEGVLGAVAQRGCSGQSPR